MDGALVNVVSERAGHGSGGPLLSLIFMAAYRCKQSWYRADGRARRRVFLFFAGPWACGETAPALCL